MQTWITDKSFLRSASNLDNKRLGAQIYEGIHILASLLNVNNKLVNPKRNVSNHPVAKMWKGYEYSLLYYIRTHLNEWYNRNFKSDINLRNYNMLNDFLPKIIDNYNKEHNSFWVTDDLIEIHRSILIQKKSEHYKKLWPEVPENLRMKYDWRK